MFYIQVNQLALRESYALFSVECICPFFVPPGVDKENVQLSPSSALSSGGRIRHGSASQVQKQRSAGSFKRPSIKKIV